MFEEQYTKQQDQQNKQQEEEQEEHQEQKTKSTSNQDKNVFSTEYIQKVTSRDISDEYLMYPTEDLKKEGEAIIKYPLIILDITTEEILEVVKEIINAQSHGKEISFYFRLKSKIYFIQRGILNLDVYRELLYLGINAVYINEHKQHETLDIKNLVTPEILNPIIGRYNNVKQLQEVHELQLHELQLHKDTSNTLNPVPNTPNPIDDTPNTIADIENNIQNDIQVNNNPNTEHNKVDEVIDMNWSEYSV